jgi:hypothetical protein
MYLEEGKEELSVQLKKIKEKGSSSDKHKTE